MLLFSRGCLVILAISAAAVGCDVTVDKNAPLLRGDGIALGNSVWFEAPRAHALVQVVEAARENRPLALNAEPSALVRIPGVDDLLCLTRSKRGDATLHRVNDAAGDSPVLESVDLGPNFNRVAVSPQGSFAVVYTDPDAVVVNPGSLNPGEIRVVELSGGPMVSSAHTLTFQPVDFLFDPVERYAMVRTVDRLLLMEMDPARSYRDHQIPLNASGAVAPALSLLVASPDGDLILAVEEGSQDLFVISAALPSAPRIENVVALSREPTDALFSTDGGKVLVLYGRNELTVMDTSDMSSEVLALPMVARKAVVAEGPDGEFALLWDVNGEARLARLELEDLSLDDWGLAASVEDVSVSPEGTGAVIAHVSDLDAFGISRPSLSLFAFGLRAPSRILLTDTPSHVAFVPGPSGFADAAVLLPESDLMVRYDMATYDAVILELHSAPRRLGVLPQSDMADAVLFVVHEQPFGLTSFADGHADLTPPGGFPAVAGQALVNLLDPE